MAVVHDVEGPMLLWGDIHYDTRIGDVGRSVKNPVVVEVEFVQSMKSGHDADGLMLIMTQGLGT